MIDYHPPAHQMPFIPAYNNARFGNDNEIAQIPSSLAVSHDLVRHETQGGYVSVKEKRGNDQAKLCLHLDQPNHFKAGDTVSGSVNLISERIEGQYVDVGSLSITFSGRCTTSRPVREAACRRTLRIFSQKQLLLTGPTKIHAQSRSSQSGTRRSFPFRFTFPLDCNGSDTQDLETGPFFNSNPSQILPASFSDESYVEKASVTYELRCELLAPDRKGYYMQGGCLGHLNLNVYSPRTVQDPQIQFTPYARSFTHQSLDLLSPAERKYHERPLTIGQKLGFKPSSIERLPKATFTATIFLPLVAVVGQPLPLKLHIDHDSETSTVATPPIIHLTKIQVLLRTENSVCSMKHKTAKGDCEQTGWTAGSQIASKEFINRIPRINQMDVRKVVDLTLDASLYPSFKSFNIARTYSLRVAGTIRCGERSFAIKSGMARCVLLAKECVLRLSSPDQSLFVTDQEEDYLADEVPPPYANCTERMAPPYQQQTLPLQHLRREDPANASG